MSEAAWHPVGPAGDEPAGTLRQVDVEGRAVCVGRTAGGWVAFDDTFSAMEDETLDRVIELFTRDLTKTTIIHIGRSTQAHLPLFARVLHLIRLDQDGKQQQEWATERMLRGRR